MIGARHHRAAAGLFHRRGDRLGIGRHHRFADVGRLRAAQHMHDHRQPRDIGQRLAGQAGRGHAGRDEDDGVGHRFGAGHGRTRRMSIDLPRLYGLPARGKPVSVRRRLKACRQPHFVPLREPVFDEFLRTQQSPRRHPRHLPDHARAQYRRRRHFRAGEAGQARLRDRGQGKGRRGRRASQRSQSSRSKRCWPSASVEKGQPTAKQCQACHTFEKGGPNRVGPNLCGIVGDERGKDRGGFNFSAAMKAKGGNWTFERAQQVPHRSARLYPRHRHDLRRHVARPAARRRDRFPAYAVRQSAAAAEGGGERAGSGSGARRGGAEAGAARPAAKPAAPANPAPKQ